jgi:hypothetical protein
MTQVGGDAQHLIGEDTLVSKGGATQGETCCRYRRVAVELHLGTASP